MVDPTENVGPADLGALIRSHNPGDDAASHDVALGVLASGVGVWRRTHFEPGHFTASGFVMSPDQSSLMLIHHARLGRWLQPGGHFEESDSSVEAAIRREVAEETDITDMERIGSGLLRIDAHDIPPSDAEPGHVHIDVAIGFRAVSSRAAPANEVLDARWIPFDRLSGWDTDESVRAGARVLLRSLG